MGNINLILEGLESIRNKRSLINEAVKVAYDDAQPMKKSHRIIRKTFGKITVPKETWYEMADVMANPDSEESPLNMSYRSKYFNLNASYEDFQVEEVLEMLKRIKNIEFERIIKIIYKGSKEKFHIEQISNLRMIFQSDRNKNHRIELRYDKKLYKRDMGEKDEEESPVIDDQPQEDLEVVAQKEADKFYEKDHSQIEVKKDFVRENMGNTINPFKRDSVDVKDIREKSGATEQVVKASAAIADDLFDSSSKEEPNISKELVSIAESLGGTMYGLDFRLKQPTSLGRKIATDVTEEDEFKGNVDKAAKNINDSIRYTVIYDVEDFTEKYFSTKEALENEGYVELRCKNFYTAYAAGRSSQKAIQCVYFKKPDGVKFELQFHTVESQGVKEINHPLYEDWRSKKTSVKEKLILSKRMISLGKAVPDPAGVFDIPEHK